MEKTPLKPPSVERPPEELFRTPLYAVVRMSVSKDAQGRAGLAVFAVVDRKYRVVWGARAGFGAACVAACEAEMETRSGVEIAAAATARGFELPKEDTSTPPKFDA